MSSSIHLLIPKSYCKKSHKSNVDTPDWDNFIKELHRRFVDCWNYQLEIDNSNGSAYKIKFDQFDKKYFNKSHFVVYIVNKMSEESFVHCMDKLLRSCKDVEKMKKIIVISLSSRSFEELNNKSIDIAYFGDDWNLENSNYWNLLENILKDKTKNISVKDEVVKSETLPIPIAISGRKSPSKIKHFFNSLPAKFESDKRKSLFSPKTEKAFIENTASSERDVRLPDINILEVGNNKNNEKNQTLLLREKVDHSKLSLNSLFKRKSKKHRESGLSINSSNSTESGSQKSNNFINRGSMSGEITFDEKGNEISSGNLSPVVLTASLTKSETHKPKIEIFKKAQNAFRSTSCLQSPKEKRSKSHIKYVMNNVVSFSSTLMTASSDIGNQTGNIHDKRKALTPLLNLRGKSEPPKEQSNNLSTECIVNKRIKYYSWNDDDSNEKELIFDDSEIPDIFINNEKDEQSNILSNNINGIICNGSDEKMETDLKSYDDVFTSHFETNEDELEISFTTFKPNINKDKKKEDLNLNSQFYEKSKNNKNIIIDTSSSLSDPDNKLSLINSSKSLNKSKEDPMESLDKLIKSIQTSCKEMRAARKSQDNEESQDNNQDSLDNDDEDLELHEFNVIDIIDTSTKQVTFKEEPQTFDEIIMKKNVKKDEYLPKLNFQIDPIRELSPELIAMADTISKSYKSRISRIQQLCHSWVRNPAIVSGLFITTTFTAPIWSSYIPRNLCVSKLFYGTLDYLVFSDIVQSIPNQIISGGRIGAIAATNTIKRFLILMPSTPWFNSYKVIEA